jgi:uncharacterized membrane protein YphA (DoxX/SURF4 family)
MSDTLNISFRKIAPAVVRIGLGLVFIWFGFQQLIDAGAWLGYVPPIVIALLHINVTTLVHFNGAFELVFGIALALGLFVRTTALLLALHIADIMLIVGYTSIGVRDFGLTAAAFSIFFQGADAASLDMLYLENGKTAEKNRVE